MQEYLCVVYMHIIADMTHPSKVAIKNRTGRCQPKSADIHRTTAYVKYTRTIHHYYYLKNIIMYSLIITRIHLKSRSAYLFTCLKTAYIIHDRRLYYGDYIKYKTCTLGRLLETLWLFWQLINHIPRTILVGRKRKRG